MDEIKLHIFKFHKSLYCNVLQYIGKYIPQQPPLSLSWLDIQKPHTHNGNKKRQDEVKG